ncbi:hypothetical protein Aduo_012484 [Ancylostoma duodenale]
MTHRSAVALGSMTVSERLREEGMAQFRRGAGGEWHQLVSALALLGVSSAPTAQKQNPSVTADTSCRMLCDVCGKFVEIARIACKSRISTQPDAWKIDVADQLIGEFCDDREQTVQTLTILVTFTEEVM